MIGWIYSDPVRAGFWTGVRTSYQNFTEHTKTIVDTSNRFRVVRDVVCDDFIRLWRPLGAKQLPSSLATSSHVPRIVIKQRGVSSITNLEYGIQSDTFLSFLDGHVHTLGCSRRRREARGIQVPRESREARVA